MTKPVDSTRPFSVLIIDPDNESAQQLAHALKACGGVASLVADTKAASRAFAELKWDVILVNATAIHAHELAKELRRLGLEKSPLLISVSQEGPEKPDQRAGFDHHLRKPVDASKLNEVLQDFFHGRAGHETRAD